MHKRFTCVVCGNTVDALFRQYGPTVLKVTNCDRCGSVADKYIEYDPVIIMLDLVLLSKQAYRHVLYNTPFKSFWKLLIVLLVMETYLNWSRDCMPYENHSKSTITENKDIPFNSECPERLSHNTQDEPTNNSKIDQECNVLTDYKHQKRKTYEHEKSIDKKTLTEQRYSFSNDPALLEMLCLKFFCVCFAMLVFFIGTFLLSQLWGLFSLSKNKIECILVLKALVLGGMGNLLMLPIVIWGSEHDTSVHSALVWGYTMLSFVIIHSVIFDCSKVKSFIILAFSSLMKVSVLSYIKVRSLHV